MPKVSSRKFVLVKIEDDGDSRQTLRRLRRYLGNHKLKYVSASNSLEMKEHLDKLENNCLVFQENVDTDEELDSTLNADKTIITTSTASTHQEALEQWARDAFSKGSEEMQLLFGALTGDQKEPKEDSNDLNPKGKTLDIPQLFTLNSIEPDDSLENGKEEGQDVANCLICECQVGIGRNRQTKIRRQAQHVVDNHLEDGFRGVEISKRYQCLQCYRTLPVSKSPCEHISEHHGRIDKDTDFLDLWTKNQLSSFNSVLDKCFHRHLPVPRTRRFRNDNSEIPTSYRIVHGTEVVQLKSAGKKSHQVTEQTLLINRASEDVNRPSTSAIQENYYPQCDADMRNDLYEMDPEHRRANEDDLGDHCYSSTEDHGPGPLRQL